MENEPVPSYLVVASGKDGSLDFRNCPNLTDAHKWVARAIEHGSDPDYVRCFYCPGGATSLTGKQEVKKTFEPLQEFQPERGLERR